MQCPICTKEMKHIETQKLVERTREIFGRESESREEKHFCTDCGVGVTALLTISRPLLNAARTPQVVPQDGHRSKTIDPLPHQETHAVGQRRLGQPKDPTDPMRT